METPSVQEIDEIIARTSDPLRPNLIRMKEAITADDQNSFLVALSDQWNIVAENAMKSLRESGETLREVRATLREQADVIRTLREQNSRFAKIIRGYRRQDQRN